MKFEAITINGEMLLSIHNCFHQNSFKQTLLLFLNPKATKKSEFEIISEKKGTEKSKSKND